MRIFGIVSIVLLSFLSITGVSMYINYSNNFVELSNMYDAQLSVDQAIYDEVWKTIKQEAGVSEKYSTDFKENYRAIMESRNYGGELMKWVQENNPQFSPDLYGQLMNTIESQRTKFTNNQKKLISIHKELKDITMRFPSSVFLFNRRVPDLKLVTSGRTEAVFATGKDDDVELFDSK